MTNPNYNSGYQDGSLAIRTRSIAEKEWQASVAADNDADRLLDAIILMAAHGNELDVVIEYARVVIADVRAGLIGTGLDIN